MPRETYFDPPFLKSKNGKFNETFTALTNKIACTSPVLNYYTCPELRMGVRVLVYDRTPPPGCTSPTSTPPSSSDEPPQILKSKYLNL